MRPEDCVRPYVRMHEKIQESCALLFAYCWLVSHMFLRTQTHYITVHIIGHRTGQRSCSYFTSYTSLMALAILLLKIQKFSSYSYSDAGFRPHISTFSAFTLMAHVRVRVHSQVTAVKFRLHEGLLMRHALTLPFITTLLRNRWIVSHLVVYRRWKNVAVRFVAMDCVAVDCGRVGF